MLNIMFMNFDWIFDENLNIEVIKNIIGDNWVNLNID